MQEQEQHDQSINISGWNCTAITSEWICTANHGFIAYAQEELRRRFGQVKAKVLIPDEVIIVTLPASAGEVLQQLLTEPLIFLRHLQPVDYRIAAEELLSHELDELLSTYLSAREELAAGAEIAIQIRKGLLSLDGVDVHELRSRLEASLTARGVAAVTRGSEWIVSIFVTQETIYVGVSTPQQNLSDWSGGALRFQREEGQISRAKFKLLEAERTFGLDFAEYTEALDIGAAPGGWTSLLLERGLKVTAIDPAAMHPSLLENRRLTILKKNASEVKLGDAQFDLLVCDMSWSPLQMVRLVTELLYALRSGGTAIVTIKLMHKKPLQTIRDMTEKFSEHLEIRRMKQLVHNRDEITLYMTKY